MTGDKRNKMFNDQTGNCCNSGNGRN